MHDFAKTSIAAIVPCHNEAAAIGKVVRDLRRVVPSMKVYVYDNGSTDQTANEALKAGAIVRHESRKGKGNVVRRAFGDVDAEVYVIIDGDDTYDVEVLPLMIQQLLNGPYDHVLGVRTQDKSVNDAYRSGHELGNKVLNRIVAGIFGDEMDDMLSGYRVMSRRLVKSFPAVSREFEIETELTVHCLALRLPHSQVPCNFSDRAEGTESKLRTFHDGFKILRLIAQLTRHERPVAFYGAIMALAGLTGAALFGVVLFDYLSTGQVQRMPTLVVSIGLFLVAVLSAIVGLVLDGTRKQRHELARLTYLKYESADPEPKLRIPRQRAEGTGQEDDHSPTVRVERQPRVTPRA